jgi:alpha-tubulin suppressor-like RCC1 family protein
MKKLLLLFSCALFAGQAIAQNTVTVCWDKIACGYLGSAAIKTDGTLWAWGRTTDGESVLTINSPQQIGTDTDWVEVITTHETFFGIKANGTLWGWGRNNDGMIGDGTTAYRTAPVQIGVDANWKMVSTSVARTLGLKTDGTIWGWGNNDENQLGNNTGIGTLVPIQIGSASDWKSISAGSSYGLGLKTNGTLWSWGAQGATSSNFQQVGTASDWAHIRAGNTHNAAIKTDGTLWTWGTDGYGQLGLGYIPDVIMVIPSKVNDNIWVDVKIQTTDTSALRNDGTWWKWGQNMYGEMNLLVPTPVDEATDWAAISMGQTYMIGIKDDGTLWGGNHNSFHVLGIDMPANTLFPSPIQLHGCTQVTASLNDNTLTQISLYPNPTSNTLTLANAENLSIEKLTVTDLTGKTVMTQNSNASQIDVQQLPAGMYLLNVSAEGSAQHLKFIKQ